MTDHYNQIQQRVLELQDSAILHFPFALTIWIASAFCIIYWLSMKEKSLKKLLLHGSFFFYLLNVIRLVFFPLPINREYIDLYRQLVNAGLARSARHNLRLFDFMQWDNLWHFTTVGNFFLLFPLGFYLPQLFKTRPWNPFKVVLTGFLFSLTIETTQLAYSLYVGYPFRGFDVDDLFLNTLGVLAAYLFFGFFAVLCWGLSKFRNVLRRI